LLTLICLLLQLENLNMPDINNLTRTATQIRRDILRMVHAVNSGHPGGSLGCTDFFVALYFEVMDYKKEFSMDAVGEDIFFLSNGHISPVFYSTLARAGFFDVQELATFRKLNSRLQGHPATHEHLPGIRIASGSLGQGLSVACGAALTKKLNQDQHLIYTLHGDGELQEGQNWEAIMFAAHNKIDNLIATIDCNNAQIDGTVEQVLNLFDVEAKFKAFGWETLSSNGNDMEDIIDTLKKAKSMTGQGKPIAILMKTEMGFGVDFMQGNYKWHGSAPSDAQLSNALTQLEETLGDY
jgi:transketolase